MSSFTLYDDEGVRVVAAELSDGGLCLSGYDNTADDEYEYHVTVDLAGVRTLCAALDVTPGARLLLALHANRRDIVRDEQGWLTAHGVESTVDTFGVPPGLQPRAALSRETYVVRWSPDGQVLLGVSAQVTWGPKGEPVFGRYYRWDRSADRWVRCTRDDTEYCGLDDAVDAVARSALPGWGTSTWGGADPAAVPLPGLDPTDLAALAQAIATWAHRDQTDKVGAPYVRHPEAVAAAFDPLTRTSEHCAGWLHDVLEDTSVSRSDLLDAGIPRSVVEVVELLTRHDGQNPDAYYAAIRNDPVALAVKRADIASNTDPARVALLNPRDRARLTAKYARALERLA